MLIRDLLTEMFDAPAPLHWISDREAAQRFTLTNVLEAATFTIGAKVYVVWFERPIMEPDIVVNFGLEETTEEHAMPSRFPTGRGDAFRVYATVLQAIRHFAETRRPPSLYLEGANHRQARVYSRIMARWQPPEGYRVHPRGRGWLILSTDADADDSEL